MRSILFHCKEFNANITGLSTRGVEVAPEVLSKDEYKNKNCVVAFITVEMGDEIENISIKMAKEIEKCCIDTQENKIVLAPFAHLSNKLSPFKVGIQFFDLLENILKEKFEVTRVHFGSDKDLMMHLFGHPGNARYREF